MDKYYYLYYLSIRLRQKRRVRGRRRKHLKWVLRQIALILFIKSIQFVLNIVTVRYRKYRTFSFLKLKLLSSNTINMFGFFFLILVRFMLKYYTVFIFRNVYILCKIRLCEDRMRYMDMLSIRIGKKLSVEYIYGGLYLHIILSIAFYWMSETL